MSRLETYRKLAPFSIDELVEAANSVLRLNPHLQISKRTIRYYITEGIISPPVGAPKYARYSYESLLRILGARTLLDQGISLERSKETLDSLLSVSVDDATRQVQEWLFVDPQTLAESDDGRADSIYLSQGRTILSAPSQAQEPSATLSLRRNMPVSKTLGQVVRRIELDDGIVLEIAVGREPEEAFRNAIIGIQKKLGLLEDTP